MTRFEICFERLIKHEGGWSNDVDDPGGPTKYGITHATWGRHRKVGDTRPIDMIILPDAKEIYHDAYWMAAACPHAPPGIDYAIFDSAVNQSPRRAVGWAQQEMGITADGIPGPQTRSSLDSMRRRSIKALTIWLGLYMADRNEHYSGLTTWWKFGRGWSRRQFEVYYHARCDLTDAYASTPEMADV